MPTTVHTWDWRGQPNLDRLAAALLTHGVHLTQVDTGSDQYAIVISDQPLTSDRTRQVWEAWETGEDV